LSLLYPGAALFLALWLDDLFDQGSERWRRLIKCGFATSIIVISWPGSSTAQAWEQDEVGATRLAQDVRPPHRGNGDLLSGRGPCLGFPRGPALDTILEWENLDIWASQPMPIYFVMPPDCARRLAGSSATRSVGGIERWSDGLRRPLVLLRNRVPNP